MKRKWLMLGLIALLPLAGCRRIGHLEPVAGEGQSLKYLEGRGILGEDGERALSAIRSDQADSYYVGPRLAFTVVVFNPSETEPLDVSEANFSARLNDQPASVIPASQLLAELNARAQQAAAIAAFAGAAAQYNASQAGYSNQSGVVDFSGYGPRGYYQGTGIYNGTTYDSAKALQAQRDASQVTAGQLGSIEVSRQSQAADLQAQALQRTTVGPGGLVRGFIIVELPSDRGPENTLEITFNGNAAPHRFQFKETIQKPNGRKSGAQTNERQTHLPGRGGPNIIDAEQ